MFAWRWTHCPCMRALRLNVFLCGGIELRASMWVTHDWILARILLSSISVGSISLGFFSRSSVPDCWSNFLPSILGSLPSHVLVLVASRLHCGCDGVSGVRNAVSLAIVTAPVPHSFRFLMKTETLSDPVATIDGNVCKRTAIQRWFQRSRNTSVLTGLAPQSLVLTPEAPL